MRNIDFKYKETSFVDTDDLAIIAGSLLTYIAQIKNDLKTEEYNTSESFAKLVSDSKIEDSINNLVKKKRGDALKYIIVIGIGGSSMGTRAIYEGLYDQIDAHNKGRFPKIIFLETVSSKKLEILKNIINLEVKNPNQILVNIISKSGNTLETNANFEALYSFLEKCFRGQKLRDRIVVTTTKSSDLYKKANKEAFSILEIPEKVGGRHSVFSAVGLFPLALCGIDIKEILEGAKKMREMCLEEDVEKNPALISASLMHLYYHNDINIHNSFFFAPELESLGKWYKQLMGESIGKEKNLGGEIVNRGVTPIVSVGSTDLHSVAQLYLAGPRDKMTTFVYQSKNDKTAEVPGEVLFDNLNDSIRGKNLSEIMSAILKSVIDAYKERELPFSEIIFPEISGYTIGQYMQMKMFEIIFLAKLLNVNAFDQPNVEEYKNKIKKYLK